jgi:hypothetical protein
MINPRKYFRTPIDEKKTYANANRNGSAQYLEAGNGFKAFTHAPNLQFSGL